MIPAFTPASLFYTPARHDTPTTRTKSGWLRPGLLHDPRGSVRLRLDRPSGGDEDEPHLQASHAQPRGGFLKFLKQKIPNEVWSLVGGSVFLFFFQRFLCLLVGVWKGGEEEAATDGMENDGVEVRHTARRSGVVWHGMAYGVACFWCLETNR